MDRSLRGSQGAILIELLLSMMLFLTALLPLMRFLARTAGTDRAADIATATNLARSRLEMLRHAPTASPPSESETINNRLYRINLNVDERDGLYTLSVRVYRGAEQQPLAELITRRYYGYQGIDEADETAKR